jgi:4-diphosphocytidyl-2-C-methyl-D-erythritol kinase
MSTIRVLKVFAPAKINLGLEVIRRRRDGYHDIETLFQTLDFGDELSFHPRSETGSFQLDLEGLLAPSGHENLVTQTWELMRDRAGANPPGLRILLNKHIPMGAGLGGGSTDAAATILALNRFWELNLTQPELLEIAVQLGSDVPFLLNGGTALGRGRGEVLEALPPLRKGAFLLVNPGISVSSAWAYEQIKMGLTRNPYRISVEQVKAFLTRFPVPGMVLKNRLEDVVYPAYPVLGEIEEALAEAGAVQVSMSGSGSTLFGTFPDLRSAEEAREGLEGKWTSWVARPLPDGVRLEKV